MNAMGRLNASTEIIPLQGPSGRNDGRFRHNFRQKQKNYFVDKLLVPRVKQYLEEHKDSVHVDMDAMVDELQRRYKEYQRRKRNVFKIQVDKAFKTVLHQYNIASGGEFEGEEIEHTESSEEEMYSEDVALENSNNSSPVAGQVVNMYMSRSGLSVTRGFKHPSSRGIGPLPHQRSDLHGLHPGAHSFVRHHIKQETVELSQRIWKGYGMPRRNESSGGDKELINISSDEDDTGGRAGSNKERGGNAPTSSGLLPTPSIYAVPPLVGPPSSLPVGRGVDSTAPSVSQSGESLSRGRMERGPVGGGGGGVGVGIGVGVGVGTGPVSSRGEPSPMRPWPPITPAPSPSPRQYKRPRPNGASASGPSPSISTTTNSTGFGAPLPSGSGAGRDSPASKRRRDTSAAATNAAGPPLDLEPQEPGVSFADLGGIDDVLEEVGRLLAHLRRPEIFRTLGVPPPRGVLLHGPPGCGKSLLARAVAGELQLPLLRVAGPELVAGVSGESEARVRDLFDRAVRSAPCVLLIDEVDALAPPRAGAQREMERRIVAQLLSCLDELGRPGADANLPVGAGEVLVLGATSRPEALDPALRRAGRFDREVRLGIPDARAREAILHVLCRTMRLASDVDLHVIAKCTPGFVGADLQALTREAALAAVSRVLDEEQQKAAQETKSDVKTVAIKQDNKKQEEKTKEEEKPESQGKKEESKEASTDENREVSQETSKDEEAEKKTLNQSASESMDVIELSDRDTPKETVTGKAPPAKADSSVTKIDGTDEDEVCIEAEVTSSDAAAKEKSVKVASSPDADEDMEVLDEIDEDDEDVVPVPGPEFQAPKSLNKLWSSQCPSLTDDQLKNMFITQKDFENALKHVQPSAKREGFATVPDISWDDVGALRDVREELQMAILAPVRHPDAFEALGLTAPAGLLLCGPPGCGKTLIAKAIANEADINFISVKGPELLNMYVGESEKAVRQCFLRARNSAPCVIFFDELDALCPRRTGGPAGEGSSATQRVVNQLLTEMDGVEGRRGVFLLAASNRPDILDPAVLRPGRLDRVVFVGLPDPKARADILRALTKNGMKPRFAPDVDLQVLGESANLDGCSGADLASLVREAATLALREHLLSIPSEASEGKSPLTVTKEHLDQAVKRLRPSVNPQDRIRYEKLRIQFSAPSGNEQVKKESPRSSTAVQTPAGGAGTSTNETQTEITLAESNPDLSKASASPSVSA